MNSVLSIIALGKQPSWIYAGIAEYQKRFPKEWALSITELPIEKRHKQANIDTLREKEQARIHALLSPHAFLILLDETGTTWNTVELAHHLTQYRLHHKTIYFVIGGPDGVSAALKKRANVCFALSKLTLPHGFARLLLVEQLYRAISIQQNHPYHRV